jgi:hypothetical protein
MSGSLGDRGQNEVASKEGSVVSLGAPFSLGGLGFGHHAIALLGI